MAKGRVNTAQATWMESGGELIPRVYTKVFLPFLWNEDINLYLLVGWRAVDRFEEHFGCRELDLIRDERDVVNHGGERCGG